MPLYNVEHSYPLNLQQRTSLAERITKLHAQTFTTPSIFVQVKFEQQDASAQTHFVAGVVSTKSVNRIIAYVRSSSSRTKEHWDKLAKQIEHAWYVVVGEASDDDEEEEEGAKKDGEKEEEKKPKSSGSTEIEKQARAMLSVAFVTGIVVREKGYAIPEAGGEEAWIKQYRHEFESKADAGDESFEGMLKEIDKRDDLKSWRGDKPYGAEDEKKTEEGESTEPKDESKTTTDRTKAKEPAN